MNELFVGHKANPESDTHSFLVNETEVARLSITSADDAAEWVLGAIAPAKFPDVMFSAANEDEAVEIALGWLKNFFEARSDQVPA